MVALFIKKSDGHLGMARNLDLTALRAFVAVVDAGGVTRAAGLLNLTQSAVSMQLKRLEDSLGMILIVLFVTVIVIEALSHWLRKRLT